MPRGGKRPGAGRKSGSPNKRSRRIADKAAQEGVTPLEVMLCAMREAYEREDMAKAAYYAKDAAPYMHPRLNSVKHAGDSDNPVGFELVIRGVSPDENS